MTEKPNLKLMSEVSMLTILIQASAIVKNQVGDPGLHGYVDTQDITPITSVNFSNEADFAQLNCLSDILVQKAQVLAASYNDISTYTLVVPSPNSESDFDSLDMDFPAHDSVTSATTLLSINAAVVPNPERDHQSSGPQLSGPLGDIREINCGRSLWIHDNPLRDVVDMDVKTPSGLANHAESVSSYLYEYGRASKARRSEFSRSFFLYLLASSWEKLHWRFRSWRALGFIMQLEEAIISGRIEKHLTEIGGSYAPSKPPEELGPGDRTLADFFSGNQTFVLDMITTTWKDLPQTIRSKFPIEKLSEGKLPEKLFEDFFKPFGVAAVHARSSKRGPLYTKESAMSFHYLLYFSFLIAGTALSKIKDSLHALKNASASEYEKSTDLYKQAILAAEFPYRLLICVLSSKALRVHMDLWTNHGTELKTLLPVFEKKQEYLKFGKERHILPSSKLGPQNLDDSEGDVVGDDEVDEVDEVNEDDITEFPEGSKSLTTFNRWVTIFVAHFLAKRTLEFHSARIYQCTGTHTFEKPRIKIFAVSYEDYLVPTWDEFKRVIREAFTVDDKSDVDAIISTLEKRATSKTGIRAEAYRSLYLIRQFMEGSRKTYKMRMHCEAVLAALLVAKQSSSDTDPLAKFYKNLGHDMISVTKLCCPVCWELFKALDLNIRISGCHPNVSPLALPETLSPEISSKVTRSLQSLLVGQLKHLLDRKQPLTGHSRNESETGYSAASSNESSSQFSGPYANWKRAVTH